MKSKNSVKDARKMSETSIFRDFWERFISIFRTTLSVPFVLVGIVFAFLEWVFLLMGAFIGGFCLSNSSDSNGFGVRIAEKTQRRAKPDKDD